MRVVIVGAGNLLLSDEGFGVHVVKYLTENYEFPDEVEIVDMGTLGLAGVMPWKAPTLPTSSTP